MITTKRFLVLTLLVALLAGCNLVPQRSSSTPPPGNTGATGSDATPDPLEAFLNQAATQTAEANLVEHSPEDDLESAFMTQEAAGTQVFVEEGAVATATPTAEATPTNTPLPEPDVPTSYTLHEGEHPFCLARRFDINAADLLAANGFTVNNAVYSVGTELVIPTDAGPFAGERALLNHPTSYTVVSGDSLYSIACQFGDVYPEQIANANNLAVDAEPAHGTVLNIP